MELDHSQLTQALQTSLVSDKVVVAQSQIGEIGEEANFRRDGSLAERSGWNARVGEGMLDTKTAAWRVKSVSP